MAFELLNYCYYFISLKYIHPLRENKVILCLEQVKPVSQMLIWTALTFPLYYLPKMSQDLRSVLQLPLKVDPASYVLRGGSFWLNKPGWHSFAAVSVILKSCYYTDLILSLSEHAAFSVLPVLCGQVKD